MNSENTLLCVFSYNMGDALKNCIESMMKMCGAFDAILIDDDSTDPKTIGHIEDYRSAFIDVFTNTSPKIGKRHGNLYDNIQMSYEYALNNGYEYVFFIQDDMQFVRPMDEHICKEYALLFDSSDKVIQVDPRFLRNRSGYEILGDIKAYRYDSETSYADVGITHVGRLKAINWAFGEGERANKERLSRLGYMRLFPHSPIIMHVPFPQVFRNGRKRFDPFLLNRGTYGFEYMSGPEIEKMDRRPVEDIPYFRDFLRPRNMKLARLLYDRRADGKIFA
ncbi:MAG: glycosyltransferase family A protein [Phyllobacterium sp.]